MKNAITNQIFLIEQKKDIRRATLEDEILPDIKNANIRIVHKTIPYLETRITALENDNKETKSLLKEIIKRMRANDVERESHNPDPGQQDKDLNNQDPKVLKERVKVNVLMVVKKDILQETALIIKTDVQDPDHFHNHHQIYMGI